MDGDFGIFFKTSANWKKNPKKGGLSLKNPPWIPFWPPIQNSPLSLDIFNVIERVSNSIANGQYGKYKFVNYRFLSQDSNIFSVHDDVQSNKKKFGLWKSFWISFIHKNMHGFISNIRRYTNSYLIPFEVFFRIF